ncbi:MAG: biosynthetic-type acetolactate synthase large subunit [Clostridia bacterium]|jgi:acetolactate synthase-1/2/3 large subunit|nr:biosynthetic-type acetolactate synthase large subunit [Clostridia bacterium]MEE0897762.1 biosynthetic-type acetolactate synthase large subunit [Acutalibacteraceae bacterium]MEE1047115.1 biosynthetic-type acetolactate synthase large subunit [Clostridia bacterium]MEE1171929.1 biosynthetic-type acetolactate synthase large subunit [Ruminococcus sp.]
MQLCGSDILVKTLIEQGCDTVFGYPGGQILNVYDSLYKYQNEINHVLTAHEQGAAHAADGYARTTGKVGVVISTSGPGATNLVTGIATAYLDSIPIVAICGNVPTTQIGTDSFQEIDITGVTLPITKHNYFVSNVSDLADTIREAFRLAKSGRPGPVLIDVPKDVQIATCEYEPKPPVEKDEPFAAKDVRIEEAATIINSAKRPFIYFGGGVITADAENEVLALAEKIDAPIGCSLMGLSAIPTDHPRFLGMQGMHGHYASSMSMHNADVILSLGVRFNDRVTGNRTKFAKEAKIVHIDVDGSELNKTVNSVCGLRGDVKLTLQKLLPLLNESAKPDWMTKVNAFRKEEESYLDNREGLTPRRAILTVNKYLGENTAVCTDVGQHQMWSAQSLNFKKARRFASSGGLGTMGYGFGAAIGAAYGTGERSVLITGDGSFGMNLNELATAVRYGVPVVAVIVNNGVLGMVRQWQTLFYDKHYSNSVLERKTDFAAFAKSFGADGEAVTTPEELDAALGRAFATDGPYIIDCKIDKDEFVLPMLPPGGSMDDIITKLEVEL